MSVAESADWAGCSKSHGHTALNVQQWLPKPFHLQDGEGSWERGNKSFGSRRGLEAELPLLHGKHEGVQRGCAGRMDHAWDGADGASPTLCF